MQEQIKGAAWALALWGAFSVIFGVLILAWPGVTLKAFLIILGVYLLASGVVMTVGSLVNRSGHWIGGALIGFLSAVAGIYVFSNPTISALAVLTVIALYAIAIGMLQVVAGFEGRNDWWMIIAGAIWTLFGFYIFANPKGGAITLVWLIGLSTIISGLMMIVASTRLGAFNRQLKKA